MLCFACFTNVSSQEQIPVMRYTYQVDFLIPSRQADTPEKQQELMYLDIWDNTSRFASSGQVKRQELMIEQKKPENNHLDIHQRIQALQQYTSRFKGATVYNVEDALNSYHKSGLEYYNLKEPLDLIQWEIFPEVVQINGMNAQRATGELSGRLWTVYFTGDIALHEGPYKFKNLPGLVIKATDDQGIFNFELISASAAQTTYWQEDSFLKAMEVNKKQLSKVVKQNSNKSVSQLLSESGKGTITKVVDENGKDITKATLDVKPQKDIYSIELF